MLYEQMMDKEENVDVKEARRWLFRENVRLEQQKKELEREKKLFEMKWKILEDELFKVAEEKKQMEKEWEEYQALRETSDSKEIRYEMFFVGVNSRLTLKKRYRDLIKIFHPDNLAGDKKTLQEINKEYDTLKQIFI